MSTVMYCYKFPKSELWNLVNQVREFYKENNIAYTLADIASEKCETKQIKFWDALNDLKELEDDYICKFQLFDMGEDWLFRVLEQGYFFMNNHEKFNVTPVFYDSRTDIPPEHEQNKEIANWLDLEIRKRQYLIVSIVDYDMINKYMWDRAWAFGKNHPEKALEIIERNKTDT